MSTSTLFFSIFFTTILVTRVGLLVRRTSSPTIRGFRLHHYMYGLCILPVGVLLHSVWTSAVGLGLFIDEATYLCIGGKSHEDNYSWTSLLGTAAFIVLTFVFRVELTHLVLP